jgi:uncharacterized protein with PQ loop repeat
MREKLRFLGLDVHAETIAVGVAEPDGEVRSLGTIANREYSIRKLIKKLGSPEQLRAVTLTVLFLSFIALCGCEGLARDTQSLFIPRFNRSEIFGFVAGFGTTFAAVPDLIAMFRRRSSAGMNPRMAAIIGVFQILWVYYGLLIQSRPVVGWNLIGVLINLLSVGEYHHFARKEKLNKEL